MAGWIACAKGLYSWAIYNRLRSSYKLASNGHRTTRYSRYKLQRKAVILLIIVAGGRKRIALDKRISILLYVWDSHHNALWILLIRLPLMSRPLLKEWDSYLFVCKWDLRCFVGRKRRLCSTWNIIYSAECRTMSPVYGRRCIRCNNYFTLPWSLFVGLFLFFYANQSLIKIKRISLYYGSCFHIF